METLVLLDRDNWQAKQIWSTWNISLKIYIHWLICFWVSCYILDVNHYLFIIMPNPVWSYHTMISFFDGIRDSVSKD